MFKKHKKKIVSIIIFLIGITLVANLSFWRVVIEDALAGGTANLTLVHYGWRNDDGDETDTGASWMTAGEDTEITNVARTTVLRVRFNIYNAGNKDANGITIGLTYGTNADCTTGQTAIPTSDACGSAPFCMYDTALVDGGDTTDNTFITNGPSSTFITGEQVDNLGNNSVESIDDLPRENTELEYGFQVTANATYDQIYYISVSGIDTWSTCAKLTIESAPANTAPTGLFNSAAQKNNGSGDVDISIEVDDAEDDDTKAKIAYEADNSCDSFSDLTLDESAGATADYNDSGGSPSVVNTDTYQVGTTADRRVITSSGSNSVAFTWNSATDQSSGDATMCLQLTVNDDTVDQTTPATQTLTIDNVNPTAPGNLTESNRRATQITLNYGSQASDTNDPGTNNYRLFYKQGTSGVAETDTEKDSVDFDSWNYGGNSSIAITGLTSNTDYVFNIWSYDTYCQTSVASCTQNKAAATEITLKTRTGNFNTYASSSQSFDASLSHSFTSQTSTMSDAGAVKIEDDRGTDAGWTLNLTANDWKTNTGAMQLDYDGTGFDNNLGKMCTDPASANLYAEVGSLTNVNKGAKDCFSASASTIDLVTADNGYGTGTYWLTDLSLEQYIPSNPTAAVYTTTIIFTLQ